MTPQRKSSSGKRRRRRQGAPPFSPTPPVAKKCKLEPSTPTPSESDCFAALDAATPPAPARRTRACIDWLRLITKPTLELCAKGKCGKCLKCGLTHDTPPGELYVEWAEWDINTWAAVETRPQWLKLELIAARYGRVELIDYLINNEAWNAESRNELAQSALISLCAQPPAEVLIFEARRLQPAILRVALPAWDETCSAEAVQEYLEIASEREQEMAAIATRLLQCGANARECDARGYCAADYAKAFRHEAVLRVLDGIEEKEELSQIAVKRDAKATTLAQCTVDTEIPNDEEVHTPRSKHLVSDDFTDSPYLQTCASNVPTACELGSNGKRPKRYNKMMLAKPSADGLLI